jgi:hypothetical protein
MDAAKQKIVAIVAAVAVLIAIFVGLRSCGGGTVDSGVRSEPPPSGKTGKQAELEGKVR